MNETWMIDLKFSPDHHYRMGGTADAGINV